MRVVQGAHLLIRTRIAENGEDRTAACHAGGICYRKLDGVLTVGREKAPTVPSEGNLCTIWGLWETHEGVEGKLYVWLNTR
jgi:hypothetical protein